MRVLEAPCSFASEAEMQAEIFQYFWNDYPQTRRLLFHCPNGGSRNKIEAVRLRAQGVVKGVPDLIGLGKNGMFAVELKLPQQMRTKDGGCSEDQVKVHELWNDKGYAVYLSYSFDHAVEVIKKEFGL